MAKTYYDARSANLTLGMEIIETNRNIKALLGNCLELENIKSLEMTIDWMDGYLQNYRKHMKLKYFDQEKLEFVEFNNYESAITEIHKNLGEKRHILEEEKYRRTEYIFWLNRWCELQASCFHKLQLLPPPRMDENNRDMLDEEPEEQMNLTMDEVHDDGNADGGEIPGEPAYPLQPE